MAMLPWMSLVEYRSALQYLIRAALDPPARRWEIFFAQYDPDPARSERDWCGSRLARPETVKLFGNFAAKEVARAVAIAAGASEG